MTKIKVNTDRPYSIYIGPGVLKKARSLLKISHSQKVFIIADKKLSKSVRELQKSLKGIPVFTYAVTGGESIKDIKNLYPLYGKLLKDGARRDALIIAVGGGSIGDAVGFLAATYLRGVSWVSVPTTLLAQVDSGVGGKTAVNHRMGKNLIGAFCQPMAVLCDLNVLKTLSRREMVSGLGEIIKYGLIYDKNFYGWLKNNWKDIIMGKVKKLETAIKISLRWKAYAVARDERDTTGVREVLNFGHTFGHALENLSKYKVYQHGESIIWGMRFALGLSYVRGKLSANEFRDTTQFLGEIPVPSISKYKENALFDAMKFDKKSREGKIHFVLIKKIGKTLSDSRVEKKHLRAAFQLLGGLM